MKVTPFSVEHLLVFDSPQYMKPVLILGYSTYRVLNIGHCSFNNPLHIIDRLFCINVDIVVVLIFFSVLKRNGAQPLNIYFRITYTRGRFANLICLQSNLLIRLG